jgi:ADP-ribose pyrophosphatase YjhB (NUDIX family)
MQVAILKVLQAPMQRMVVESVAHVAHAHASTEAVVAVEPEEEEKEVVFLHPLEESRLELQHPVELYVDLFMQVLNLHNEPLHLPIRTAYI